MRKPYTLDMSIYRDVDRCAAVENILADLDITPSDRDLEQMADYIICGKESNLFKLLCFQYIFCDLVFDKWLS